MHPALTAVPLGVKVRDVVSGAEGTVVARCEWMNGCCRVSFQPALDKDGKVPELVTVDWEQLEVLGEPIALPGRVAPVSAPASALPTELPRRYTGGDRNDAAALRR